MAQEELQESKLTKAGGRKPTHGCNYPMVGWPSVILTPMGPSLNLTREGTSRPSLRSSLSLSPRCLTILCCMSQSCFLSWQSSTTAILNFGLVRTYTESSIGSATQEVKCETRRGDGTTAGAAIQKLHGICSIVYMSGIGPALPGPYSRVTDQQALQQSEGTSVAVGSTLHDGPLC